MIGPSLIRPFLAAHSDQPVAARQQRPEKIHPPAPSPSLFPFTSSPRPSTLPPSLGITSLEGDQCLRLHPLLRRDVSLQACTGPQPLCATLSEATGSLLKRATLKNPLTGLWSSLCPLTTSNRGNPCRYKLVQLYVWLQCCSLQAQNEVRSDSSESITKTFI